MCEHNLEIGRTYLLVGGYTICADCSNTFPGRELEGVYIGDVSEGVHRFRLKTPEVCPHCKYGTNKIDLKCDNGEPINVTQEFLSLPVRAE